MRLVMPRQKHARAEAGFTLIELLVAVLVFVILTALAVPSFTTYLEKSRVRGAADSVVNAIAQARQVAVKYDRNVSLATAGSGTAWCIGAKEAADPTPGDQAGAAAACDCGTDATQCTVDGQQLVVDGGAFPNVAISSNASTLAFDGRLGLRSDGSVGNADESSFDLTAPSGRYAVTVKISPLGTASVCNKTGNILGYPAC
ncbi:MAG TPA: GspH/FimT family pseudopilin [Lysobacter sp.]|jgi:type IV fimbrial biogenesis protein FimT|nr:GspH/FimT family pseudopilin [Lysobacter sp.]